MLKLKDDIDFKKINEIWFKAKIYIKWKLKLH